MILAVIFSAFALVNTCLCLVFVVQATRNIRAIRELTDYMSPSSVKAEPKGGSDE